MKTTLTGHPGRTSQPVFARRRNVAPHVRPSPLQPAWALRWLADVA